jgi:hypothetical protein
MRDGAEACTRGRGSPLSKYLARGSALLHIAICQPEDPFIETIADLAGAGITDVDGLTAEQMQTVFVLYATNAIESRLCNDIGAKSPSGIIHRSDKAF